MNTRKIAIEILNKIEDGAYSGQILHKYLVNIEEKRDKALVTELVYGVLRNKYQLDFIISKFSRRNINKIDKPVLNALRTGIYQISFLDTIPVRAAINETVQAVKKSGNQKTAGFVNAILRSYDRNKDSIVYPDKKNMLKYLEMKYSHPKWLIKLWLKEYGYQNTERLCKYNNRSAELYIRINTLKFLTKEVIKYFHQIGIKIIPSIIPGNYKVNNINSVEKLPLYKEGGFIVQGPAATLAGLLMDPLPGSKILDIAAGPGGKTTHLVEIMQNRGKVVALDIYQNKIDLINKNCRRLDCQIVEAIEADGTIYQDAEPYDMILVDAPCSGLGLVRQKPEIRWNRKPQDIDNLLTIQEKMLNNAARLLRKGGFILYSNCTLNPRENRYIINKFLRNNSMEFKIINLEEKIGRAHV